MKVRDNKLLKVLDRYIGIPLILLLGQFAVKAEKAPCLKYISEPRIALLKTAAIGDTVLLSAIIHEIRQQYPQAIITFICSANNRGAVKLLDGVDHIFQFEMSSPVKSLCAIFRLPAQAVLIDFAPWARINGLITYFAKAKYKVGFSRSGQWRHFIYDCAVEHRDDRHELDNYRQLLAPLNIRPLGLNPAIAVKAERTDSQLVVFHPFPGGSGQELKKWPKANWVELGVYLESLGYKVVLSGGQEDINAADDLRLALAERGCNPTVIAGKYSLTELCELLAQSRLLITVNTGIMHLGAALGVPIVALHGPTSPLRWGPVSDKAEIVVPAKDCAPCISLGFEYGCNTGGCMETISTEIVRAAVDRVFARCRF